MISTKIDKPTIDRPHFFIAYGTKSRAGLKAFRDIEYKSLKLHEQDRYAAKERDIEAKTGQASLFSALPTRIESSTMDGVVKEQIALARIMLLCILNNEAMPFARAVSRLIQPFTLRETNVKDLCVTLAKEGLVEDTWSPRNRKPIDQSLIRLKVSTAPPGPPVTISGSIV